MCFPIFLLAAGIVGARDENLPCQFMVSLSSRHLQCLLAVTHGSCVHCAPRLSWRGSRSGRRLQPSGVWAHPGTLQHLSLNQTPDDHPRSELKWLFRVEAWSNHFFKHDEWSPSTLKDLGQFLLGGDCLPLARFSSQRWEERDATWSLTVVRLTDRRAVMVLSQP